jgi:hypothetical protein
MPLICLAAGKELSAARQRFVKKLSHAERKTALQNFRRHCTLAA